MKGKNKPNVVFILTDDQRYDTIHALGNPFIKTPNLDALCAEGVAFTHAHIQGGTVPAVCMPSRAMINTGRGLFSFPNDGKNICPEHALMGETFRSNGYVTFATGKWHNGPEGFARSFSDGGEIFFGGMWDHWNVPTYEFDPTGKYERMSTASISPYFTNKLTKNRATHINMGIHSTDLFTDTALDWLQAYDKADPFFMYLAYMAPHDPRSMPEPFASMYNPDEMPLECFCGEHFRYGIEDVRDEIIEAYPRKADAVRRHIADYFGMISHLDDRIGKLVALLKHKGLYDNTIIVFTSDNGLAVGRHGLMGKQSCYEHGIRVPLIMKGPGIPKDSIRHSYHYLLDIYPTLCSLCGIETPVTVEGMDFSLALADPSASVRDEVYAAYGDKVRTIKDARYKLIEYRFQKVAVTQLFDLDRDPLETMNLADDPGHRTVRDRLRARLRSHAAVSKEMDFPAGKIFWGRFDKTPGFVEPEAENWMITMYKP